MHDDTPQPQQLVSTPDTHFTFLSLSFEMRWDNMNNIIKNLVRLYGGGNDDNDDGD